MYNAIKEAREKAESEERAVDVSEISKSDMHGLLTKMKRLAAMERNGQSK